MRWAALWLACACGRWDFDPIAHDGPARDGIDRDGLTGSNTGSATLPACADTELGSATGSAVATGTLTGADGDNFSVCAGNSSPDRAFAWTAPASGSFTFSICNSAAGWDSVLDLYDAATCTGGNQPPLVCRDDTCGSHESVSRTLIAGARLVIVIDGWLDRGAFVLDITQN